MNSSNDPSQQQPQGYSPPPQGPQQFNPEIQNVYPSFNPNNLYAQQPQNPILVPQKNKLDELDQGWFQCYKIFLYVTLVLGIISIVSMVSTINQNDQQIKNFSFYYLCLSVEVCYIVFVFVQIQAIQERSISKAKITFIGFQFFGMIEMLLCIYFAVAQPGETPALIFSASMSFVSVLFIAFGSACVFGFLEKHKPRSNDRSRNFNNVAQNNATISAGGYQNMNIA